MFVAVFVVLAAWFSFQAVYSSGNIGTGGKFTASSCEETFGRTPGGSSHKNGSSHELQVTCDGTFRPDGGTSAATSVRMTLQPGDAPVSDGDAYLRELMNTGGKGTELHTARLDPDSVLGNFLGEFNTSNTEKTQRSAFMALGGLFFLAAGIFCLRADWPRGGGGSVPLKVAWRESVGPGTRGVVITVASAAVIGIIAAKIFI
ncbi:hypothetical protein ACOKM3_13540 [Streptomyces sp. BH106]|uniref:hypothetical protein n=1 Tax=Streptomyces sp. BH106 TaxID=3410409 RepID=UPI003CED92F0